MVYKGKFMVFLLIKKTIQYKLGTGQVVGKACEGETTSLQPYLLPSIIQTPLPFGKVKAELLPLGYKRGTI